VAATIKYVSNLRVNLKLSIFNLFAWLPCGRYFIEKEQKKIREDFIKRVSEKRKHQVYQLPDTPWKEETIMRRIKDGTQVADKYFKNGGHISGGVYTANEEHWNFISDCMRQNIESNPLHAVEFSNVTQLEAEIIRITLNLYRGPEDSCGLTTSGGTESIIIAMLAYREWGRARGITKPNIVTAVTAHPAFDKACFYFDIENRKVPLEKNLTPPSATHFKRYIDSNTVCLVASAPEFPYGSFDKLVEVASLAKSRGINCHSDCCLGSYINPFTELAGFNLPSPFDFGIEGVTSISCDPHKFCYGPKGCSIVLFRTK
jgi:sphinganine-1-phosphate aldolase